jgi:hypothetical protein
MSGSARIDWRQSQTDIIKFYRRFGTAPLVPPFVAAIVPRDKFLSLPVLQLGAINHSMAWLDHIFSHYADLVCLRFSIGCCY